MIPQEIAATTAITPTEEVAIATTATTKVTTGATVTETTTTTKAIATTMAMVMAIVAVATTKEEGTTTEAAEETGTTATAFAPTTMAATTTIVAAFRTLIHALCLDMQDTPGVAVIRTPTILIDRPGTQLLLLHQGLIPLVMLTLQSRQSESNQQPLTG